MYGDPRTTPGGLGKDYAFFTRLEVRRSKWHEIGSGDNKEKIGQEIKVRVFKNKSSAPGSVATIDFYFKSEDGQVAGGFDFAKETVSIGKLLGVLERKGAWYYYAGRQWNGEDAILASVREEIDLKEALEKDVLDAIKAGSKFVNEE